MTVSIAICAHVARTRQALALAVQMRAPVAMDDGTWGSNANHDRAFQYAYDANPDSDWCLLVEDDAIPVTPGRITDCLANCPTDAASLYLGTSYPRWEQPRVTRGMRYDWIIADIFLHGVAMAVRTHRVPTMLTDAQAITADADRRYGLALQLQGVKVSHTTRSLFDHRDEHTLIHHDDGKGRTLPRVARMRADNTTVWRSDSRVGI